MNNLNTRFKHHPPTHNGIASAHEDLRTALRLAAEVIETLCPEGREKSLALTRLEEAMFWGNAAIARAQKVGGNERK